MSIERKAARSRCKSSVCPPEFRVKSAVDIGVSVVPCRGLVLGGIARSDVAMRVLKRFRDSLGSAETALLTISRHREDSRDNQQNVFDDFGDRHCTAPVAADTVGSSARAAIAAGTAFVPDFT